MKEIHHQQKEKKFIWYATSRCKQQPAQEPVAKLPEAPPEVEKTKGTLTVAFGRFNPPTTGHEKLLNQVAKSSDENDYIIVPSRSHKMQRRIH